MPTKTRPKRKPVRRPKPSAAKVWREAIHICDAKADHWEQRPILAMNGEG
jgi:hypothetical protein